MKDFCSFTFGIPSRLPIIPGFTVFACSGEFMHARQGKKFFVVEEFETHFRLSPRSVIDGELGGFFHFDQCIRIPKARAR